MTNPTSAPVSQSACFARDRNPGAWQCPCCGAPVHTPYCATCGERRFDQRDLTLRTMLSQVLAIATSINGRAASSFRCLVTRPGALTLFFAIGLRKPFLSPIKVFLIANGLFFALQILAGMHVFATPLSEQVREDIWGPTARALLQRHLLEHGLTRAAYEPVYDHAVLINAKSLVGLMVLPFALMPPLLFWRSARPFSVHLAFSLHFHAFMLLAFCLPAIATSAEALIGTTVMLAPTTDVALSFVFLAAAAVYLYRAIGAVYACRGIERLAKTALLVVTTTVIFFAYRFFMLPFTLATT